MLVSIKVSFLFQQHIQDGLTESPTYAGENMSSEDVELVHAHEPAAHSGVISFMKIHCIRTFNRIWF